MGLLPDRAEVVTIEIDIEDADRDLPALQRFDLGGQPLRKRNASPPDSDEGKFVQVLRLL